MMLLWTRTEELEWKEVLYLLIDTCYFLEDLAKKVMKRVCESKDSEQVAKIQKRDIITQTVKLPTDIIKLIILVSCLEEKRTWRCTCKLLKYFVDQHTILRATITNFSPLAVPKLHSPRYSLKEMQNWFQKILEIIYLPLWSLFIYLYLLTLNKWFNY